MSVSTAKRAILGCMKGDPCTPDCGTGSPDEGLPPLQMNQQEGMILLVTKGGEEMLTATTLSSHRDILTTEYIGLGEGRELLICGVANSERRFLCVVGREVHDGAVVSFSRKWL